MEQYLPYVERLEGLLKSDSMPLNTWTAAAERALDGEPSRELRRFVDLAARRADGAFFTGSKLARRLVSAAPSTAAKAELYFDPACGAGDLLLAAARSLPIVPSSLCRTLRTWGPRLAGIDKHEHFIRATRARLAILAISRGAKPDLDSLEELTALLPNIHTGDALVDMCFADAAGWLLLNPPFQAIPVPHDCEWATGAITAAALFLARATASAGSKATISAILPDVLRSGSRYRAWREVITAQSRVDKVLKHGIFDASADVDVFLLHLTKCQKAKATSWLRCPAPTPRAATTIGSIATVHVGPVVPHRHPELGPAHPYVHAKALPRWVKFDPIHETRRFTGRVFMPPFVAVRRTSRPNDPKRAVATIITGRNAVAVENHILVVTPHAKSLTACHSILKCLRSPKTDAWLNRRICCRHLTVSSVASIPLEGREL